VTHSLTSGYLSRFIASLSRSQVELTRSLTVMRWPYRRMLPLLLAVPILLVILSSDQGVRSEFERARQKVEASDDWCFGRAELRLLSAELRRGSMPSAEKVEKLERLATIQLRLGQNEDALESLNQALGLVDSFPELAPKRPTLHGARAVVWLRLGELRNCSEDNGTETCIFPLRGSGVHQHPDSAQMAFADLQAALNGEMTEPGRARYRWLLNITAMQLGTYPEAVPPELRLKSPLPAPTSAEQFINVAPGLGMHEPDLCGGVVVEDMDSDGYLDIVTSGSGFRDPVRFWRNLGNGSFEERTEVAGLSDQVAAFNIRAGDYDNDGDQDLLLLRGAYLESLGEIRNSLLRNEGDGTFTDVTHEAGLAYPARPTGTAVFGDFNQDGLLDIFVGNESRAPYRDETSYPCQMFQNNGDGTFTDVAEEAGVNATIYAKGVAAGDMDNDGDLDLVVTNFSHWRLPLEERGPDLLYRNRGDGTFEEVGQEMGFGWMGGRAFACWFFDYDNDGWLDLFVARYEAGSLAREVSHYLEGDRTSGQTRLYRNLQGKRFENVSRETGLDGTYSTMGCSFGDLDNDGFLDLYLGTGSLFYHYLVPNVTLQNRGGTRFEDATLRYGLAHLQKGHGIAFADFDHDGDQDIFTQLGGNFSGDPFPNALFQNPGNDQRFLHLVLRGAQSVGARVKVTVKTEKGTRDIHRAVGMVSSFGHTPLRQEVGLGQAVAVEEIEIRWPSGKTQIFQNCPLDTLVEIREDDPELRTVELTPMTFPSPQGNDSEWCFPSEPSKDPAAR
jgi:hypothetical protein